MDDIERLIDDMMADPRHGWSLGTFGAVGEFMRDEGEPVTIAREGNARVAITARGGLRVAPRPDLRAIAYDTLARDGESWGQSLAFCLPAPADMAQGAVRSLGTDREALRAEDRDARLFDTGTGLGLVRFCVRTRDPGLIGALEALEGQPLFSDAGRLVMSEILRAQPARVVTSPVARVEVYSPIPAPDGTSPEGPHTHLLPKLVASGRTHAANAPIPAGLQPVLMLHPGSPWRDAMGQRVPFDSELDEIFEDLFLQFGLPDDLAIRAAVEDAVEAGTPPDAFASPATRRGRVAARIALRRLARTAPAKVEAWRRHFDHGPDQTADSDQIAHEAEQLPA